MRTIVFLLVLGNLLFFAWGQGYFGVSASPDAGRPAQQIEPERLRIVGRGEPPAAPAPVVASAAPAAAPADAACLHWAGLSAADADRLAAAAREQAPDAQVERRPETAPAKSWWVYIPPLANKAEAERKSAELKKLEVKEFYVISDAGPNRLAISLGVFSSEAAARVYLDKLRAQGVKSAKAGARAGETSLVVEVRGGEAQLAALRTALAERPPGDCPAPGGAEAASPPPAGTAAVPPAAPATSGPPAAPKTETKAPAAAKAETKAPAAARTAAARP